jgi:hypothetical protein
MSATDLVSIKCMCTMLYVCQPRLYCLVRIDTTSHVGHQPLTNRSMHCTHTDNASEIHMTLTNVISIEGQSVTITCQATGTPQPTVKWQVKTVNSQEFGDIASASNTTTYEFTCQISDNGNQYRAIADNGITEPSTSDIATLTVIAQQQYNERMHNEIQQMLHCDGRG